MLPEEIEHICPDYSLYGVKEAYGFLTRGCVNRCPWCVVPHKEGEVRAHADIEEFLDGHKHAVLLDNNVLASEWGLMQIEKIVRMGIRVDFNQGLDARRIARTPEIAALLARVKWIRFLRMAYDSRAMQDDVHKAIELLRKHGVPARRLFFYVLIRDDTEDALGRIRELKALGCQPFAQPYRDFEHEGNPRGSNGGWPTGAIANRCSTPWIMRNTEKPNLTIELMNRLKIKYAVAYGFLATTAVALIASLFTGCHVYEHEEVEIIRCPVIEADTIDIPGWDKEIATPNFNRCHDEKTVDLAPGHAFDARSLHRSGRDTGSGARKTIARQGRTASDDRAAGRHPRNG
ncbi:MAG: hypothetical protein ACLRMJ_14165 [Alistipes finegoldii]